MEPRKRCPCCDTVKPKTAFANNRAKPDKLANWCRSCTSTYQKGYRERNRAKIATRARDYRAEHREEVHARHAKYYQANKARINAQTIARRAAARAAQEEIKEQPEGLSPEGPGP